MAGDSLCKISVSECFNWRKLFEDAYPEAYSDIITNEILRSCINLDKWKILYESASKWKIFDFRVGIGDDEHGSIVFYWDIGRFSIYSGLNI